MRYIVFMLFLILIGCEESSMSDYCKGIDCGEGFCVVQNTTALCICNPGYLNETASGRPRCVEDLTDPCRGVSCNDHGVCAVMGTRPICLCDTGYYHDTSNPAHPTCLSPEDLYCGEIDCGGHGRCYVVGSTPHCDCDDGYKVDGLNCLPLSCDDVLCSGRGRCIKDATSVSCDCDAGFEAVGLSCLDINRDRCINVLCDEWRQCDPMIGLCDLKEGRCGSDRDCSVQKPFCDPGEHICIEGDPDPCHPNPCEDPNRRRCEVVGYQHICLCEGGYRLNEFDLCEYDCSFLPFSGANSSNDGCECLPGYRFEERRCNLICGTHQYASPDQSRCLCELFYSGNQCVAADHVALVFGGAGNDQINGVIVDQSGIAVAGSFEGSGNFNPHTGFSDLQSGNGGEDCFVTTLARSGYYRKTATFGWGGVDRVEQIYRDSSGNLYLMGTFEETININPSGYTELISAGGVDLFLIKYSSDGTLLWGKRFGGVEDDLPGGLSVGGQVVITGSFQGNLIDDKGGVTPSKGDYDLFFFRFDRDGNQLQGHTIGGAGKDLGIDLVQHEGGIILLGSYQNSVDFNPGAEEDIITGNGSFITRLGSSGDYLGTSVLNYTTPKKVVLYGEQIVVGGIFKGNVDFDPGSKIEMFAAKGGEDLFMTQFDQSGNYLSTATAGSVENDQLTAMTLQENTLFLAGYCGAHCSQQSDILQDIAAGYIFTFDRTVFSLIKTFPKEITPRDFQVDDGAFWIGGYFEDQVDGITPRIRDGILYGIKR